MRVRQATLQDNDKLIDFFKSIPVKGDVEFQIDRAPDFFAFYRIQSSEFVVYIMEDDEQRIHGCASFVFRKLYLGGTLRKTAWAYDLRIAPNRKASLEWMKHFLPIIKELQNNHDCELFFTCLNLNDKQAMNTFIHSRKASRPLPRYFLFRKFNLITLHGFYPWAAPELPTIQIQTAVSTDYGPLTEYLQQKSMKKNLSPDWSIHVLFDRLKTWKSLKISDFLIARDAKNKIVGCVAPWSGESIERKIPIQYTLRAHNFRQFLKFGKLFGMSRPLIKAQKQKAYPDSMNQGYLTHLNAENPDVLSSLIQRAFRENPQINFFTYLNFEGELLTRPIEGSIHTEHPFGLYLIVPPEVKVFDFLNLSDFSPTELEPSFI